MKSGYWGEWLEWLQYPVQQLFYSPLSGTTRVTRYHKQTLTHPPSWSSSKLYQLLPSTMIHSIFPVQITCLASFLHNLSSQPLWSTSWSGAFHLIFHTFLHPISVFFSQHMPILSLGDRNGIMPIKNLRHLSPEVLIRNNWRKKTGMELIHLENS